ncbi:MAG: hypothetical protein DWC10_05070 [Candidatus Poseidoniales archaeon]|nr:MAG: hypothetical protein DWC10_05070 [Candidatus Poseidoniales archaeon]
MVLGSMSEHVATNPKTKAANTEAMHRRRMSNLPCCSKFNLEPRTATAPQPAAWNMVHQPSPISMFESNATSTANATPRRAPSCAPTSNAATVTGWMFGKGCITTRKATTETTNVANPANRIGVGRGVEKRRAKARPTKTTSATAWPSGESSGPWTPMA